MVLHAKTGAIDRDSNTQEMDRSIKPGDDFYRYANGGWLKTVAIPAGQTSYDTRAILAEKTSQRVRDLIQEAAAAPPRREAASRRKSATTTPASWTRMRIEAKGLTPLADEMAAIAAITNKAIALGLSRHDSEH